MPGSDPTIEPALDSGIYSSISTNARARWVDTTNAVAIARHGLRLGDIAPLVALLPHGGNPSPEHHITDAMIAEVMKIILVTGLR